MKKQVEIVIRGGPAAGKTTLQALIIDALHAYVGEGFDVVMHAHEADEINAMRRHRTVPLALDSLKNKGGIAVTVSTETVRFRSGGHPAFSRGRVD